MKSNRTEIKVKHQILNLVGVNPLQCKSVKIEFTAEKGIKVEAEMIGKDSAEDLATLSPGVSREELEDTLSKGGDLSG